MRKAGANSQAWFTLVVTDVIQGDARHRVHHAGAGGLHQGRVRRERCSRLVHPHGEGRRRPGRHRSPAQPERLAMRLDGKGIDHAFAAYGEAIFGSYGICGMEF